MLKFDFSVFSSRSPPLEDFMTFRRLASIFCICCLVFSLFVTPAFAVDSFENPIGEGYFYSSLFDGTGGIIAENGYSSRNITLYELGADNLGGFDGTYVFNYILGASSNGISINVPDSGLEGYALYVNSSGDYVRRTVYLFLGANYYDYKPSSTTYHLRQLYSIVPSVPNYTLDSVNFYSNIGSWLGSGSAYIYQGCFVTLIPSDGALLDFLKVEFAGELPLKEIFIQTLSKIENFEGFVNTIYFGYDDAYVRDYDFSRTPRSGNLFIDIGYYFECLFREKASQTTTQAPLNDLRDYQDDLISNASKGLPSMLRGFRQLFSFFDISESTSFSDLDIGMATIGYKNYFGNESPAFFSATTRSNLEVNIG